MDTNKIKRREALKRMAKVLGIAITPAALLNLTSCEEDEILYSDYHDYTNTFYQDYVYIDYFDYSEYYNYFDYVDYSDYADSYSDYSDYSDYYNYYGNYSNYYTNYFNYYANYSNIYYYNYSDIRLKENILPVKNSLEKVNKLNGVKFNWKNNPAKEDIEIGLIAQEVKQTIPELVRADNDGLLKVNYGGLTAILLEAIKEQTAQINELKKKIETLEKKSV